MLHRFIALIARDNAPLRQSPLTRRILPIVAGWTSALDTDLTMVWVLSSSPSRLGAQVGAEGRCVIGADFERSKSGGLGAPPVCVRGSPLSDRWGAYVSITVDEIKRTVTVLRDPTGRVECWRISTPRVDVLFSHYSDVYELFEVGIDINWEYIIYHLNNNYLRGKETALTNILEVLPGEKITYHRDGIDEEMSWWPHIIANERYRSPEEAVAEIRSAAETSVGGWADRYASITLDLSGGLDSAIVLGLLRAQAKHGRVIGVNYLTGHPESDERSYAREAARMHGIEVVETQISAADLGGGADFSRRLLRPAIRTMPLGYDEIGAQMAKRLSADAFFTGTGGDHLFFDHLKASAACDYRHHHGVTPDLIHVAHELARVSRDTVWNVLGVVAKDAFAKSPGLRTLLESPNPFISSRARTEADYDRFVHPWFSAAAEATPPAKLRQIMNLIELQRHYYRYGRADVAEEVHPLFSQPVMEASLRTPAYWFGLGGLQRGLARRAFSDLLPPMIRTRRTKSANSSHWIQVMARNLPRFRELLLDGWLAQKGLVNRAELEQALTPLALSSLKQFVPLVGCITTEMWLQKAKDDLGAVASPRLAAVH
jgi:asparagine synthase (glutamine-hydrolysing)